MNWTELLCKERIRSFQKSTISGDLRTEFEKDYHRIIGSSSFRRLQDKTQVFPLDKSDYVRTRLTHSLEVSSFAKSLAQMTGEMIIRERKDNDFTGQNKEDISNILQCAGLLHDIGNPPFGHFGETTIRDWFKRNMKILEYKGKKISEVLESVMLNDFYHFEGNAQAFRLVTKLHFLVDDNGMNLTKALLGTIIKYPVSSVEVDDGIYKKTGNIKYKKIGYFHADRDNFNDVQKETGTNGNRHPLTYLLEAADDIAYKTADIEDSFEKGKITYEVLLKELETRASLQQDNKEYIQFIDILKRKYDKALKKGYQKPEIYAVQNWVVNIQGSMIYKAAESFINNYNAIMDGLYKYDLFYNTSVEYIMHDLGDIAYKYSFTSKSIYKLEIAASMILEFLLDKFIDAVIYYDTEEEMTSLQKKLVSLISKDYMRIYKISSKDKSEAEKLYLRLLLVTDYISGMTDGFAKDLYQELTGII